MNEPDPCRCPAPNAGCRRAGAPMVGNLWKLCSGNCPPRNGMPPEERSRNYRAAWDAAPRDADGHVGTVSPFPPRRTGGVGTELRELLSTLGFDADEDCGCKRLALEMDARGPEWCRENRAEIEAKLRESYNRIGWPLKLRGAVAALGTGVAFRLDCSDPAPGLLDEALRRWEAKRAALSVPDS